MSKEEKKEEKKEEGAGGAPPAKSKKKLIIIAVVLLLVLGGAGGFLMMGKSAKPDEAKEEHQEEEIKHYETVLLEPFIVNLSANSSFLKLTMLLEYDPKILEAAGHGEHGGGGHGGGGSGGGEKDKGGLPGILGEREPMIRDSVIRVLSSKRAEDVLTTDGKEHLKEELIEAINEASGLEEGPIVAIYFTEFMIQ